GRRESTGDVPLEMTYTADRQGHVNAEVMRYIDDIQFKEMSDELQRVLERNDQEAAVQVAREMEKKAELIGKRAEKKTMLIKQVLQELNAEGRASRKTQLKMEDAARTPEMP